VARRASSLQEKLVQMPTLLIVDDDNLVRETLHDLLSSTNECHTADRAEQALAYLDIETYDAVLTDISMPELSGRELLKNIQANHPATPVIVISGESSEADAAELIAAGAFAYFAKPFKLEDIEDAVERAVARHQELTAEAQSVNSLDSDTSPADTETSC
jgi:DNA-binding NtrC family response regulator